MEIEIWPESSRFRVIISLTDDCRWVVLEHTNHCNDLMRQCDKCIINLILWRLKANRHMWRIAGVQNIIISAVSDANKLILTQLMQWPIKMGNSEFGENVNILMRASTMIKAYKLICAIFQLTPMPWHSLSHKPNMMAVWCVFVYMHAGKISKLIDQFLVSEQCHSIIK